jgi:putative transposase
MIDTKHEALSVRHQCELLSVNRSSLYYKEVPKVDETDLSNEIHEIWLRMPFYGYRRITATLCRLGYNINHKRVARIMKEMKLRAIYPMAKTSIRNLAHTIYPYLLKDLTITRINQAWMTDITYIKLPTGFVYLVALIDVHSRYIISWRLSITMESNFCLEMLEEALSKACPEIINTDQGCQFTSQNWVNRVLLAKSLVSMDGKGRWADNVYIERFWRSIKYEHIMLFSYTTVAELRSSIGQYIELYNNQRLHQSLGYRTPAEVYNCQSINLKKIEEQKMG